ncbi:DUF2625 family protein [Arthrobacter sp. ISL-85]|nr:DUF2625 family protein [Arthrobacter sp. ISL-85]
MTPTIAQPPGHLVVAYDVLGVLFTINSDDLTAQPGKSATWGPDTLEWTPLGTATRHSSSGF